jgi:hypothetical protein
MNQQSEREKGMRAVETDGAPQPSKYFGRKK